MEPLHGVTYIQGDFREDEALEKLEFLLEGRPADLVLSDMAPNMSGVELVDQSRVMHLAELTLEFARQHLKPGGDMLVKVFQGVGFMEFRAEAGRAFGVIQMRKPAASRGRSAEIFLLARKKRE
jgi:23S rRNA (uridine2552-2'-O)-methyltransferase